MSFFSLFSILRFVTSGRIIDFTEFNVGSWLC